MNRNLVGSIYGRSSIEIANFIPIHQQTWSPQAMLVSDWSILSSPGPKVHGNYCHHLASVVCKLFTFQASSPKPLGQLEPNLAGMFLGWSSTKKNFFRSSQIFNMVARANNMLQLAEISKILFSETNELTEPKLFQNASSLKPLGQLKPNCPGIII